MLNALKDDKLAIDLFQSAAAIIDRARNKMQGSVKNVTRFKSFTGEFVTGTKGGAVATSGRVERGNGTIKFFSDVKGWGFIDAESRDRDVFVHFSQIRGLGYRTLEDGMLVDFAVVESPKGLVARDVEVRAW